MNFHIQNHFLLITCHGCVEVRVCGKLDDAFTLCPAEVALVQVELQGLLQVFCSAAVVT